jgi:hypothetical protein
VADRIDSALAHFLAGEAVGVELDVAGGNLDDGGPYAQTNQSIQVFLDGTRKAPDFGLQPGLQNQLDGLAVLGRDPGKAGFDAAHAHFVQLAGEGQLLLRVEHHADGLLTVAQGSVVEAHRAGGLKAGADFRAGVQFADPDAVSRIIH